MVLPLISNSAEAQAQRDAEAKAQAQAQDRGEGTEKKRGNLRGSNKPAATGGGGSEADPFFQLAHDRKLTVAGVRAALRRGVDLDAALPRRRGGRTALMRAATAPGSPRVVKYLVDSGAGVDVADRAGKTALMWAAQHGRPAMVKALLRRGADAKRRDAKGRTALHYCTASHKRRGDSQKCARYLQD